MAPGMSRQEAIRKAKQAQLLEERRARLKAAPQPPGVKAVAPPLVPIQAQPVVRPISPIQPAVLNQNYTLKEVSPGLFNVVSKSGKVMNEKPLPKSEANEVLSKLN